jgi:hypothetical protein
VIGGVFFNARCNVGGSYQANFADDKKTTVTTNTKRLRLHHPPSLQPADITSANIIFADIPFINILSTS